MASFMSPEINEIGVLNSIWDRSNPVSNGSNFEIHFVDIMVVHLSIKAASGRGSHPVGGIVWRRRSIVCKVMSRESAKRNQ